MAYSSRSPEVFPSDIEKHYTTLTRKNFSHLAHFGKQEPETSTGNLSEKLRSALPVTFFTSRSVGARSREGGNIQSGSRYHITQKTLQATFRGRGSWIC